MTEKKVCLVIQTFGRENEYKRAMLTVLSFFVFHGQKEASVLIFTDKPERFKAVFEGLNVDYVLLTADKIREMRGDIDFLHRMKIALIEEAFSLYPEHLLCYADSDTFYLKDVNPLLVELDEQTASMHVYEYPFEDMKDFELPAGETFRAAYRFFQDHTLQLTDGSTISIRPKEDASWNAGVMCFHPSHSRFIPDVYALTQQIFPASQNHASEQYAFSIVLQRNVKLIPCWDYNYHYWYRTKKQIVDWFLGENLNPPFESLTLEEKKVVVRQWLERLPLEFKTNIRTLQDKAVQYFNIKQYRKGYKYAFKALLKQPGFNPAFYKDILYHTKQFIANK